MKELDNLAWNIFRVVYNASAHLPLGSVREYWDAEALAKKDEEIRRVEQEYRADVISASQQILRDYAGHLEDAIAERTHQP
jgi:hypothetical protein